jgi:hypothetical protein
MFSGVTLTLPRYEIVDCDAFCEIIFFCIWLKNLLGDFFYSLNDLDNLRGRSPILKPDAAIQRQVDAVVMAVLFLNLYISYGKDCHRSHDGGGLWKLSSACDSHTLYAGNLL